MERYILCPCFFLLGDYLDVRDARRLYGFLGFADITGSIICGFVIIKLLAYVSVTNLLFFSVGALVFFIYVIHHINKNIPLRGHHISEERIENNPIFKDVNTTIYIVTAMVMFFLFAFAYKVVYYQLYVYTEQTFSEKQFAHYLAQLYVYIGIAQIGIQILLTSVVMRRFGIRMLYFLPSIMLLGSAYALYHPGLFSASMLAFIYLTLFESYHNTIELLFLVLPWRARSFMRSVLGGFTAPAGVLASGILFLVFSNFENRLEIFSWSYWQAFLSG